MAPSYPSSTPLLTALAILTLLPLAQGGTGSGRTATGQCPANAENLLVYSPFKPYFTWWHSGDVQKCWVAADCVFEAAGESRKQQFAATALVMGLIPLTLKDIACPERRLVSVSPRLNPVIETVVLALGLVPLETKSLSVTRERGTERNMLAKAAWRQRGGVNVFWAVVTGISVGVSYAGLVFMEVYSKRSALGCPFPFFIAVWYLVALVPAAVHCVFAGFRRRRQGRYARCRHAGFHEYHGCYGRGVGLLGWGLRSVLAVNCWPSFCVWCLRTRDRLGKNMGEKGQLERYRIWNCLLSRDRH